MHKRLLENRRNLATRGPGSSARAVVPCSIKLRIEALVASLLSFSRNRLHIGEFYGFMPAARFAAESMSAVSKIRSSNLTAIGFRKRQ